MLYLRIDLIVISYNLENRILSISPWKKGKNIFPCFVLRRCIFLFLFVFGKLPVQAWDNGFMVYLIFASSLIPLWSKKERLDAFLFRLVFEGIRYLAQLSRDKGNSFCFTLTLSFRPRDKKLTSMEALYFSFLHVPQLA